MQEFLTELARFSENPEASLLDPMEQFIMLNRDLEESDRKVQIQLLSAKYNGMLGSLHPALSGRLSNLGKNGGGLGFGTYELWKLESSLPPGDAVGDPATFIISRMHFDRRATCILVARAVGMDLNLYAAGYTTLVPIGDNLAWSKVAVIGANEAKISPPTMIALADNISNILGEEIRNLIVSRRVSGND